ncbi:hypothetical protein Tco_1517397 [Tanacetum coccineum]
MCRLDTPTTFAGYDDLCIMATTYSIVLSGCPNLGPERPEYSDLSLKIKERNMDQCEVDPGRTREKPFHDLLCPVCQPNTDMPDHQLTMSRMQLNSKFVNNILPEWGRFVTAMKLNRGLRDSNYDQLYAYLKQHKAHANENKIILDRFTQHTVDPLALISNEKQGGIGIEEQLLFIAGGQDITLLMMMWCEHPVQDFALNVDKLIGNMILYEQYVKDNAVSVVQSNVSSVPNDAYMMIFNDMHEPHAQPVSVTTQNTVVDNSLTAELATYKEQVELYERRARFELTEREQKIDEQLRIVITDRNIKEETLKKELHSVKMQLASTINHNKSMVEEVTSLKKDFKQKENKYLEEFLDMKALKEKVEDKLYKQDQSLQTVHMLCKPKPYYNEQNKVAIGYKNPLCLTRAKQVQPALYNGYEIIKNNHVPAIVHNTEDTLEIAEITRRKMNDKMKDPECVTHKVKIAPPDYSKDNYLATFTPQKQLTPEQIFWSQDLIKMKAEALKKQTTTSRPIKALTVYPPNTPATLVPRVLPTKSQVKINIFTLIQLFSEFEKTCKKRITPTGLTEGERGFEQTKECYLTEVIPFFKTLKEHFEGIQKALTKEIKEMKDVFEELEAEVDQNVVDRKHDEIERKNLLIAHDNLIADCLSKEVFYVATNSELNVSRFTEMHDAHTIVEARCLELEAELSNLRDKIQKDNHNELVKRFSNLEVNHLNLQLKYQNLKESFRNNPSTPARDTPDFDSVFVIEKMKASLQGKDNVIKKLRTQISQLKEARSEADRTLNFRTLDFQITQLTEMVSVLQEQNELFRAENEKVKHHYKELYDSIKITRAKHIEQTTALLTENENLKAQIHENLKCNTIQSAKPRVLALGSIETLREIVEEAKVERPLDRSTVFACRYTKHFQELLEYAISTCPKAFNQRDKKQAPTPQIRKTQVTFDKQCDMSNSNTYKHVKQQNTQKTNVPVPPSTGVNYCTNASGSQPRSNTKKNKISPAKGVNKKKVEEHHRTNKSNLRTTNCVDSSSSSKRTIINSNSDSVCPTCNKCLISANHDVCVVNYLQSVKASHAIHNIHNVVRKVKQVWKSKQVKQVWKLTSKVLTSVGHQWRPTCIIFTLGE